MNRRFYILILFLLLALGGFSQTCSWIVGDTSLNNPEWLSCTGSVYTIYLQPDSNTGVLIVDWDDGTIDTVSGGLSTSSFLSHNYPDSVVTYNIVINDTTNNCVSYGTLIQEEQTNSSIELPLGQGTSVTCAPGIISFINNSTDVSPYTYFEWDFGDGTPVQSFGYTNAGDTMNHMYMPGTVDCATTVSLIAYNNCNINNPSTATFNPVNIYEKDEAIIEPDFTTLCYPDTIVHYESEPIKNCINDGNTAQRLEKWNFGDYWGLGVDSIIDWVPYDPPNVPGHDVSYPGIGAYVAYLFDSSRCGVDTDSVVIQITSPPAAELNLAQDSVCQGSAAAFTHSNGGVQNTINYGDGSTFYNFSSTAYHIYSSPGTYQITAVSTILGASSACSDTAYDSITVMPLPNPQFTRSPIQGCDSLQVTFINNSTGATSFNWNLGFGNTSSLFTPPVVSYTTAGQHWITLQAVTSFGCVKSVSNWVKVFASPVANFSAPSVCEDLPVSFSNLSTTGYGGSIISRLWSFGDSANSTSNLNNPSFTYSDSGIYEIELVVNTQYCHDTVLGNVQIEPKPITEFQKSDSSGCSPLSVTFSNQSTGANSYSWNFGNGSVSSNSSPSTVYNYTSSGGGDTLFFVTLQATSSFGCVDEKEDTIFVAGNPDAAFSHDATPQCAPLSVNFSNQSVGAISSIWSFGDGDSSSLSNTSHTYSNSNVFIENFTSVLTIESINGCTDSTSDVISVYPEPIFPISSNADSGCTPLEVQFQTTSGGISYDWDFGDGDTLSSGSNSTSHTFINDSNVVLNFLVRLVTLSAFNCFDTTYDTIMVFPGVSAQFSVSQDTGCQPLFVEFANQSVGGDSFFWYFENGDSLVLNSMDSVSKAYSNYSSDTLIASPRLSVSNIYGCTDTSSHSIVVFRYLNSSFSSLDSICSLNELEFLDSSSNAVSWFWDFDDGDTSDLQNPNHIFENNDTIVLTYQVNLLVASIEECLDDTTMQIAVQPSSSANISASLISGCPPLEVEFYNLSLGATSINLNFGNGDSIIQQTLDTIQGIYYNTTQDTVYYYPTLIAENIYGCNDTMTLGIEVFKRPFASFNSIDSACSLEEIQFSDSSQNAQNWSWDFNNGNYSSLTNPVYTFENVDSLAMPVDVYLLVTSAEGCVDDTLKQVVICPNSSAQFISSAISGCPPLEVEFYNLSTGAVNYIWDFNNGDSIEINSLDTVETIFFNSTQDTIQYFPTLVAENQYGCNDTADIEIELFKEPIASFTAPYSVCSPLDVVITNESVNASIFNWTLDTLGLSNLFEPTIFLENLGLDSFSILVELNVSSIEGCEADTSQLIEIDPNPISEFHIDTLTWCSGNDYSFQNNSVGAVLNYWQFGIENNFELINNDSFAKEFSNYQPTSVNKRLTLVVENEFGCRDTFEQIITVLPHLESNFASLNEGCSPLRLQFINLSLGANLFEWNFGDGSVSYYDDPIHTFHNIGSFDSIFNVQLKITSPYGCQDSFSSQILVRAEPLVSFLASPILQRFPKDSVFTVNNSSLGFPSYRWDFGDSTVMELYQPPVYSYGTWGEFDINLDVTNANCSNSDSLEIRILPPYPVVSFDTIIEGCSPLSVKFFNQTKYVVSWFWDFGDGTFSNEEFPVHSYLDTGVFDVTLIVSGYGGDFDTVKVAGAVKVNASPEASFTFNPQEINNLPWEPVFFKNFSSHLDSIRWDFGDNTNSSDTNPRHNYLDQGSYYPSLEIWTDEGCKDEYLSVIPIYIKPQGNLEVPNAFTPNTEFEGSGQFQSPFYLDDEFELGSQIDQNNLNNQIFFPIMYGVQEDQFEFRIYNRWGQELFFTTNIFQGWTGYYNQKVCQQDVYLWHVTGAFITGQRFNRKGEVLLIR
jgi:PKD repeat protein